LFTAEDFQAAILRLMPRGAAWSRAPDAMSSLLAKVWGATFARNSARASNLIVDAFPSTAVELLADWEQSLGLPDPCAGTGATIEQRRSQVLARLTDRGGSSIAYFTGFAATLGYDVSIAEYAPSRCGVFRCGDAVQNEDWAYCWLVLHPGYTPVDFRSGVSASGEALMSWSNGPLVCEFEARNPSHLILHFGQNGDNLLTDWGGDLL